MKRAMAHDASAEKKRAKKAALGLASTAATPATTTPGTPVRRDSVGAERAAVDAGTGASPEVMLDLEKKEVVVKRSWWRFGRRGTEEEHETIRPSIRDVNPLPTMASIFKRPTNALILFSSGEWALCFLSPGRDYPLPGFPSLILHERPADMHTHVAQASSSPRNTQSPTPHPSPSPVRRTTTTH